ARRGRTGAAPCRGTGRRAGPWSWGPSPGRSGESAGSRASRRRLLRNWCAGLPRSRLFRGPADGRIRRVLCIVAHPDDIDFYCAGTVALMVGQGAQAEFVLATSGDKGTRDAALSGSELAARREGEQLASARRLGAARVEFLRYRDAELVESLELRAELVREIRRSRPDVLFTFDP